jgi:hypothetical protein
MNVDGFDPLKWWLGNKTKFQNVGLLARQILGILGS